ncbi:MAG TPA: bifunctional transcriptional activator/DNA repair enzyme AdaA [Bacilli bacterium]|nr:bifunctional transcriptional activator/DNA repair enzyme AdaA [Bacilli bacterium]
MMQKELWEAIVTCDPAFDGQFYYGVLTTGIFCRPSCKSRTPKPANVQVFLSAEEAVAADFRACKRCKPEQLKRPEEELALQVKQVVEARYTEPLSLEAIATELHLSPYHLHKVFKRVTGTTPAEYVKRIRLAKAREMLRETEHSITEIALAVGFANMAHFSTVFQKEWGLSPTAFRASSRDSQ